MSLGADIYQNGVNTLIVFNTNKCALLVQVTLLSLTTVIIRWYKNNNQYRKQTLFIVNNSSKQFETSYYHLILNTNIFITVGMPTHTHLKIKFQFFACKIYIVLSYN